MIRESASVVFLVSLAMTAYEECAIAQPLSAAHSSGVQVQRLGSSPFLETINLGVASTSVARGDFVVLHVSEYSQGGTDLNGDGDAADSVVFIYAAAMDRLRNTGLAGSALSDGSIVLLELDETAQGGADSSWTGSTRASRAERRSRRRSGRQSST